MFPEEAEEKKRQKYIIIIFGLFVSNIFLNLNVHQCMEILSEHLKFLSSLTHETEERSRR